MSTTAGRYQVGATGRWTGVLEREDGARVGIANITDATMTLIDAATGTYIRGTTGTSQDIWTPGGGLTNNVAYADTTDSNGNLVTTIGWDILATDVALVTAGNSREEHVARIVVTYAQDGISKTIRHEHRLRCVDAPSLCTYDDVLASLPELDEATARPVIEDAIEAFSALVEKTTLRRFRKSTAASPTTEVISVRKYQSVIQLERYPIVSVSSVEYDSEGSFSGSNVYAANEYAIDSANGQLERRYIPWFHGVGNTRIVYAGGLYRDTGEVDADLRWAAVQQVAHWFKFKDKLGVTSVSVPGSSVTVYSQKPLIPTVQSVVDQFRRPRHW